jgi:hypothetical protein
MGVSRYRGSLLNRTQRYDKHGRRNRCSATEVRVGAQVHEHEVGRRGRLGGPRADARSHTSTRDKHSPQVLFECQWPIGDTSCRANGRSSRVFVVAQFCFFGPPGAPRWGTPEIDCRRRLQSRRRATAGSTSSSVSSWALQTCQNCMPYTLNQWSVQRVWLNVEEWHALCAQKSDGSTLRSAERTRPATRS